MRLWVGPRPLVWNCNGDRRVPSTCSNQTPVLAAGSCCGSGGSIGSALHLADSGGIHRGHGVAVVVTARAAARIDHGVGEAVGSLAHGQHERAVHCGLDLLVVGSLIDVEREGDVDGDDVAGLPWMIDLKVGGGRGGDGDGFVVYRDGRAFGGPVGHADLQAGGLRRRGVYRERNG